MKKDKIVGKTSMNELLAESQSSHPRSKQVSTSNEKTEGEIWSQDNLKELIDYNENIANIDPQYSSITPLTGVILRVFLNEPQTLESGLLLPYKQMVSISTQNGMAEWAEVESPYPYSNKAIVVAVPENSSLLKQGDIVQLNANPIKARSQGVGHNATITIPSAYLHPNANTMQVPIKISDPHYGYLMLPFHEIIAKI